MYKTVIFDMGRVLIHFDFEPGFRILAEACPHSPERIPRIIEEHNLVEALETGRMSPLEFFEEARRLLSLRMDFEAFCGVWTGIFTGPLVPESLLEGLAARYRLLLLSNTNALHFGLVTARYHSHFRHFHGFVLSHEIHAMKPDPRIYEAVLREAGCLPGECFYTDDIPEFVEAARRHGIDAEVFQGAQKLEQDLRERGIEWQ
ncbi:MAG TPA: HAD family phosphatase [Bryobacteraceae bacterium]|nr:HAD family phosphatase [Bryobacteraceae bacterium]